MYHGGKSRINVLKATNPETGESKYYCECGGWYYYRGSSLFGGMAIPINYKSLISLRINKHEEKLLLLCLRTGGFTKIERFAKYV